MRRIPLHEELIIGGDLNGHVGKDRSHFEREHGGHGYGQQNPEGKNILSFDSRLHHHQKRETKEYLGL